MFFCSTFEHSLDEKGRIRIPAKLKSVLGTESAILAKGTSSCLAIHPQSALENIMSKLNAEQVTESADTKGLRMWASSMHLIEEDGQGRFVLPQLLKTFAKINKHVVFVGLGRRIELWAKEVWLEYNADVDGRTFDLEFNKLSERGI